MDAPRVDKRTLPSRHVTEGPERAPHRSYLYAMGLGEAEIPKDRGHRPRLQRFSAAGLCEPGPGLQTRATEAIVAGLCEAGSSVAGLCEAGPGSQSPATSCIHPVEPDLFDLPLERPVIW